MNYLWPEDGPEIEVDPDLAARRLAPVIPFRRMGRRVNRLFTENILTLVCVVMSHLGVMVLLLVVVGLLMKIIAGWVGLVFGLLAILFLIGPVMRMISCHLALNLWDDANAAPLEAAFFTKSIYFKSLAAYLWSIYYEVDIVARALPSIWPGLFAAAALHAALHFLSDVTDIFFWDVLVFLIITIPLAAIRLWERIRRINFLYSFTAFEIVDGKTLFAEDLSEDQPGYWRGRFARLFYRLEDEWWQGPLNKALMLRIGTGMIWALPAVLILVSGMGPMAKLYLVSVFGLTLRYAVRLWYDASAAGWFRENFSSSKYY